MRRRSHSRRRGPDAIDSTLGGIGAVAPAAEPLVSYGRPASRSTRALCSRYSACWRAWDWRPWRRSLT